MSSHFKVTIEIPFTYY